MRNFRNLRIWQDGIDLAIFIYKITQSFPREEQYGLTRQLRRAVVSIPSNTAEGCSRESDKEFCRFLEIGLGSGFETETQIVVANRIGILEEDKTNECLVRLWNLQKATTTMIKRTRER